MNQELLSQLREAEFPFVDKTCENCAWIKHLLNDKSWKEWRKNNPDEVLKLKEEMKLIKKLINDKENHAI